MVRDLHPDEPEELLVGTGTGDDAAFQARIDALKARAAVLRETDIAALQ